MQRYGKAITRDRVRRTMSKKERPRLYTKEVREEPVETSWIHVPGRGKSWDQRPQARTDLLCWTRTEVKWMELVDP